MLTVLLIWLIPFLITVVVLGNVDVDKKELAFSLAIIPFFNIFIVVVFIIIFLDKNRIFALIYDYYCSFVEYVTSRFDFRGKPPE